MGSRVWTRAAARVGPALAAAAACVFAAACGAKPEPGGVAGAGADGNRVLVATINPAAAIARRVAGDRFKVVTLLGPGASPHTYEPRPSDVRAARDCAAVLMIDESLDGWAARLPAPHTIGLFQLLDPGMRLKYGDDDAGTGGKSEVDHDHDHDHEKEKAKGRGREQELEQEQEQEHERAGAKGQPETGHEHHDHGVWDAHFWSDPRAAKSVALALAGELGKLEPEDAATFRANAEAFGREMDALDAELAERMKPLAGSPVFLFHPSFRYFIKRYGLKVAGVLETSPGKDPTPRQLRDLIARVKASGAPAIFTEPQLPKRPAEALAQAAGVGLAELDPNGGREGRFELSDLIRYNAQSLESAFGRGN